MTPEQIEKIQDPFTQADTSTTREFGGTGLGLSITKKIIEEMGGVLMLESTPGIGTKFYFALTFNVINTPPEPDKEPTEEPILDMPVFDHEILLFEDNMMNQEVICEHLKRIGIRTVTAKNGQIGIEILNDRIQKGGNPFDLILMDIQMPVMDGLEAAANIIEMKVPTPIVALTANIMEENIVVYKKYGMVDCLGKPFTTQELWHCLLKYLKPVEIKSEPHRQTATVEEDTVFQKQLQSHFAKNNQDKFTEISGAIKEGDLKLAHRLVHTLKSNAGMIGKTELQEAAADAEALLKNEKIPDKKHMDALEAALISVLNELGPFSSKPVEQTERVAMTTEEKASLFIKLESLLTARNPDCLALLDDVRSIPGTDVLVEYMEKYNFKLASQTLVEHKKAWM
jgi:CheY-like chemotaxis protein